MPTLARKVLLATIGLAGGCASPPPAEPPPLRDMEEPLGLFDEPGDEAERVALPAGGFTGVFVSEAGETLESLIGEPSGLTVTRVVENSPGDAAGIEPDDILLDATIDGGETVELGWASQWRQIELDSGPGTTVDVVLDRAGRERRASIDVVARLRPAERQTATRYREEGHVGVVVRTATEVESRPAGLGPGGGAVIVGLSRASPWRRAGLRFGDLITEVNGRSVDHPQVLLEAIREADTQATLALVYVRDGTSRTVDAPVSRRATETTRVDIPLIYSFERDRDREIVSILLGIYYHEKTPAAWTTRILWIFSFAGGDSDRLREVSP
ncbi:MAG: PDZ domain-containing protein [Planctomycetota bacterium]|jgi:C-terminal processing protease CtpA/Prc